MIDPLNVSKSLKKPMEGGASYPLKQRLFRAIWTLTWFFLAAWTPSPFRGWRNWLLRLFGAQIHRTAIVHGSARIWFPPNLFMDAHATLGPRVNCYCMGRIEVGERAVISQGAHLCGGTHDIDDPDFQLLPFPILIGRNAWIAAEAFVGPGVEIGEGAVLGARAVTVKNLLPWTVYAGNPARSIRRRGANSHD